MQGNCGLRVSALFGWLVSGLFLPLAIAAVPPSVPRDERVTIALSNVHFDGVSLSARVRIEATRDTLVDTRIQEFSLLWPTVATRTCSGEHVPFVIPMRAQSKPGRGEEVLLRAGDAFERTVVLWLRIKPPQVGCVDFELVLLGPGDGHDGLERLGKTRVRVFASARR
jgi:hypothetical protein